METETEVTSTQHLFPGTEQPEADTPTETFGLPAGTEVSTTMNANPQEASKEEVSAANEALSKIAHTLNPFLEQHQNIAKIEVTIAFHEAEWKTLKDEAAEEKKAFDAGVFELRAAIRELTSGQKQLPFPEEADHSTVDPNVDDFPIEELGMTLKQNEKLKVAGIKTIGDLETRMRENQLWHWDVKGFGPTAVDRLTDKLLELRQRHPIETADEPEEAPPPEDDQSSETEPEPEADVLPDEKRNWNNSILYADKLITASLTLPDAAKGAGFDPLDTIVGIRRDILEHERVTDEQVSALKNIDAGIAGWNQIL